MTSRKLVDRAVLRTGDIIDQRYKIRKTLGEGAFGAVYMVDDLCQHQPRALKVQRLWEVTEETRQKLCDRFREEYNTGRISSECIVNSLSWGEVKGNPYIVMQYCPGGDLTPLIGKAGNRAASICHDILVGLNALHTHGKVHRDLKPENVLFTENGRAALTDFGIVGDIRKNLTETDWRKRPKEMFGTHAYMAPEQRSRTKGATKLTTTDMFSFGVLAYQLLTGRLPFGPLETWDDLSAYQERAEKGQWDGDPLRRLENGQYWWRLIEGCLRTDYTRRIRSAAAADKLLPLTVSQSMCSRDIITSSYRPAPVTHGYQLRVLDGQDHNRVYNLNLLRNGRPATLHTIGRSGDNDICVRTQHIEYLSRHHCTIEADQNAQQWKVLDGQWDFKNKRWNASCNGTYVNSSPVRQTGYYLKPGDIITIGEITMRFENY